MARPLVLVVDDTADVREFVAASLTDAGCRVVLAADGLSAFTALATESPDLIVLDLMMPVLDGWRLLENMRGFRELERIPVVAMSSVHGGLSSRPPVDAFVAKPFEPAELVRVVLELLGQKDAGRARQ